MPPSNATEGQILLSPRGEFLLPRLGDWKIPLPLPSSGTHAGVTLNPYMEPDAADINPIGRQPNNRRKEIQSAPFDVHFDIDSIVLNAPVADVYAYCSRFEELPRFITSLRDAQKIDETLFWPTSLLRGESRGPPCRSCCVFRSGELHGKHSRTIFRVVSFCSSRSLIG